LIQKQEELLKSPPPYPSGLSAEWTGRSAANPDSIYGGVCDSCFAEPRGFLFFPKRLGFPLYNDLHSWGRYLAEVLVRYHWGDWLVGWLLYICSFIFRKFDDPVEDFLFFMDGDTAARKRFENKNRPQLFPIVQQTFVVPIDKTEAFVKSCLRQIAEHKLRPTESDMLFVLEDECLLSANYHLNGWAVSFAFEVEEEVDKGVDKPPEPVRTLLRKLSKDCLDAGGRIHLPKNSHVDKEVFRKMFNGDGQIEKFEKIKRQYDPDLLLQNPFSDRFFEFKAGRSQSAS
jgi:FAD/FMN-containing dehydrogenase